MTLDEPDLPVTRDLLDLPDGRMLEWTGVGPADGPVVLFHHGTPSGATPLRTMTRPLVARGFRLVTLARAGYGRSDRRPGRDVASVTRDVSALLDALSAETAYVAGWSGGGPHALACGALLGPRVLGVSVIAGVAPYGPPDLDFMAGMGAENVAEFGAAIRGEAVLRPLLDEAATQMRENPEALGEALGGLLSDVDRAALTGDFAEDLAASMTDALAPGVDGWLDDDLAFTRPWGFDLEALAGVQVDLWQGSEDLMVPYAHGEWLASHIPGVRAHLLAGEGHVSVGVGRIEEILDALVGS